MCMMLAESFGAPGVKRIESMVDHKRKDRIDLLGNSLESEG